MANLRETETWKLIALLGGLNLAVGLVLIAVGAAYDFLGRSPGMIAMVGVTAIGGPWLALAKHMQHQLAASREDARALDEERRRVQIEAMRRDVTRTGAHRTLQALMEEHGEAAVVLALQGAVARREDRQ